MSQKWYCPVHANLNAKSMDAPRIPTFLFTAMIFLATVLSMFFIKRRGRKVYRKQDPCVYFIKKQEVKIAPNHQQPSVSSQQYFSLVTNQHQLPAKTMMNVLFVFPDRKSVV